MQRVTLALRILFGSASLMWLLIMVTLTRSTSAQSDVPTAISEGATDGDTRSMDVLNPDDLSNEAQSENAVSTSMNGEDISPNVSDSQDQPPVTDLETGLPLRVFLTPLHWSRFSLLSVTSYEGYNSNPQFQRLPIGAWVTSVSSLALFSSQFAGWNLNLQYQPFVWISSNRTLEDFAAASGDLRTLHHINENLHWTFLDRMRYSPTHSAEQSRGFISDPGGGFSIGNAFLSNGRNVFVNGASATLTDRYDSNSTLTLHADQDYTRLSSFGGGQADNLPVQSATAVATGLSWRKHLSEKNILNAEYTFRHQSTSGTSLANVNSNSASIGIDHKFSRTVGASVTAGPAWSSYAGHGSDSSNRTRTTVHGAVALSEEFRRGGVVVSFARSNSFSGIISNSFHNRYDITAHREFSPRFHVSATGSYIQQQTLNQRNTTGELATAEARYFVARNWAVFSQVRYLSVGGNNRILGPEKSMTVGLRWSWVPEKP
jgi:hypothetical protein